MQATTLKNSQNFGLDTESEMDPRESTECPEFPPNQVQSRRGNAAQANADAGEPPTGTECQRSVG